MMIGSGEGLADVTAATRSAPNMSTACIPSLKAV